MTSFRINGHPKPKPDESIRGYLLRLAELNGFKGIRIYKNKFGLLNFDYNFFIHADSVTELFNRLAPALFTTPEKLEHALLSHWTWNIYQSNRTYLQGLFNQHCRICPLCLNEDNYYRANWEFALTTYCEKHQCYLIDECTHCKSKITWQGGYLNKCHHCGGLFTEHPANLLPKCSPLVKLVELAREHFLHSIEKIVVVCI